MVGLGHTTYKPQGACRSSSKNRVRKLPALIASGGAHLTNENTHDYESVSFRIPAEAKEILPLQSSWSCWNDDRHEASD